LVSGKVRWRGRPTASDELLGPGSSRDARRGRASVRSMVAIWVPLVAPLPSAVLMKAHRAPIICQACHQAPLFSAGETGEPGVPRRTGFFPPSQPFVIGPALPPRLRAPCARRDGRRRVCGVTKHVLVAHVPEPQDTDGVTELARFRGHVSATMLWPTRRPMFPSSRIRPLPGGPSGSSPLCKGKQWFFSSGRTAISAWRGRSCLEPELDGLSQQVLSYENGCRGAGQRGIP
jgi:hypothetical protein